jgi:hypothetical protein
MFCKITRTTTTMPIVEPIKVDTDAEEYDSFRPGAEDLQKDDVQKRLKEIEDARNAALQQKRARPMKPFGSAPAPERGFYNPVFDQEHGCWKSQSKSDYRQVKVWDQSKKVWRSRDSNSELL